MGPLFRDLRISRPQAIIVASLAFLAGWGARPAGAQETHIAGVVHDSSGAAVQNAQVQLKAGAYSATVFSDSSGAFDFEHVPQASGTIDVTAKDMTEMQQSWAAQPGATLHLEVLLKPLALSQQIFVTAARTPVPLGESPVSSIELSRDDLESAPPLTLDDDLRQVPGFSLFRRASSRTANPTTLGVSLRGLGANGASRALILEDGLPLNDPFGGWVYWDRVPSDSVQSVEIVQEGASSLYGSEALGGVIQFLTRRPEPGGVSVDASYGNQNSQDLSLSGGGGAGPWIGTFAGEAFHTDGYFLVPAVFRGSVDTQAATQHGTADAMVGRKIGSQDLIFARGWYFDDSRNNGTIGQINNIRFGEGAAGANLHSDSLGSLTLRAYGEFERYHQNFFSVPFNQNSQSLTDFQTVPAQGIGGSAVWSRALGRRQTVLAGVDDHQEIGRSDELKFTSGTNTTDTFAGGYQQTTGVFGEDLIEVGPRWMLTVSARYDDWRNYDASSLCTVVAATSKCPANMFFPNRSYNAFSPRAGFVHQINANVSWSASVYRAFRAPTLNELYRGFRVAANQTNPNANLQAERLTGGEASLAVNGFNQRLQIRGTFFFNEIINPISTVPCPNPNPTPSALCPAPPANTFEFARENLGRTSAPGFEIDSSVRITDHFTLSGGYQYVDARVISAPNQPTLFNTPVQLVPRNVLTFEGVYNNPRLLTFSVDGRLVGKQYDTNLLPMGSFFVLDAFISRNIAFGTEVYGAVENAFNEQYVSTAETFTNASPPVGVSPPQIGLPIAARIGVRFQFPKR